MPPGYKTIISVETSPIGAHRTVLAALDGLPADMPGAPKSARAAPRGARTGTDGRALAPARYLTRGSPGSGRPVRNTREVGPGLGGSPGGRAVEVDWASRGGPRWRNSRVRRVAMVPGPRWRARNRRRRRRWRRHRATGSGVASRAPIPKKKRPRRDSDVCEAPSHTISWPRTDSVASRARSRRQDPFDVKICSTPSARLSMGGPRFMLSSTTGVTPSGKARQESFT